MQLQASRDVACPHCAERTTVPLPDEDVEVTIRPYVAAFGDHTTVTCSSDHTYWVYFCP